MDVTREGLALSLLGWLITHLLGDKANDELVFLLKTQMRNVKGGE